MSYGDAGGATGYLVGEANQGMRYMFTMMNNARLSVGLQGLSIAERAYQDARAYANERRQGRAVGTAPRGVGGPHGDGAQSLIVEHADVRPMLLTMPPLTQPLHCPAY